MGKGLQGDCLHVLKGLETDSVDLVFGSPPYEDARLYGKIGFKLKGQDWVDWAIPRFEECLRVCRGLVAWVIQGKQQKPYKWSCTPALLIADLHRRGINLRNPPIFHRTGIPGSELASENVAPFPEKLALFFVKSFCLPKGIVLDPFSGSGTTAAVAVKTGRDFIAVDLDPRMMRLTRKRVWEARRKMGLFNV